MSVPEFKLVFPAGTLQPKEKWSAYYAFAAAFDPHSCARIIELGQQHPLEAGTVRSGSASHDAMERDRIAFRDCRIRWIPCAAATIDLFRAISEMVTVANSEQWQIDITGFIESLQFTEYDRLGANYHWHSDTGGGVASLRKLSFSLQLSPADAYEGGDLEFTFPLDAPTRQMFRQQGTAIIFPSYLTHRVTPITAGKRISLVGWIAGPPYR
jgi:PKHD-type hydroxylase